MRMRNKATFYPPLPMTTPCHPGKETGTHSSGSGPNKFTWLGNALRKRSPAVPQNWWTNPGGPHYHHHIIFNGVFCGLRHRPAGGGASIHWEFLGPGLIMMTILQNAFANTSTSLIQQAKRKYHRRPDAPPEPSGTHPWLCARRGHAGPACCLCVGVSLWLIITIQHL